ncbi:MAG: winged helix-turn-helix domain-containing protein [Pirellula sp.]
MTTKTIVKTVAKKTKAKGTKATSTKATKKNATVAKPAAKKSKPATKKLSQIEAAVAVLTKAKQPMNCKAIVEAMQVEGLWSTPGGATPEATLYASILREINGRGKDARFKKVARGMFSAMKSA